MSKQPELNPAAALAVGFAAGALIAGGAAFFARRRLLKKITQGGKSDALSVLDKKLVPAKALSFNCADRLSGFLAPTVWAHFTPLAKESNATNLGQGFPGWSPPEFVQEAARDAIAEKGVDFMVNQYARIAGLPSLCQELAAAYTQTMDRKIDWLNEIIVTNGATEALFCTYLGLLNPGDEVIFFEPAFDIYIAQADMAGATSRSVPLFTTKDKDGKTVWTFDFEKLKAAFNSKTRMIVLNTPHNPTGKVFSRAELEAIAGLVKAYPDVVCVCDEVYQHLVYDGHEHIHMASLDGMWDRTLTISSAGKTFSVTGWKVGWVVGPAHLVKAVTICHSWTCFSVATPLQEAIARSLNFAKLPYKGAATYYAWLKEDYVRKRAILIKSLTDAGITPIVPEGSFFIMGQTESLKVPEKWLEDKSEPYDYRLCRWLTVDVGVAAIPPSAFYSDANKEMAKYTARFAFCKPDEVLLEAGVKLLKTKTQ